MGPESDFLDSASVAQLDLGLEVMGSDIKHHSKLGNFRSRWGDEPEIPARKTRRIAR